MPNKGKPFTLKLFFNSNLFLIAIISIAFGGLANWMVKNAKVYPYGDGIEYVLMTESLLNHGSPDVQVEDVDHYLSYLTKVDSPIYKRDILNDVKGFVINKEIYNVRFTTEKIDGSWGIILGSTENLYPQHFWFYSLLAVPARATLEYFSKDITQAFLYTNLALLYFSLLFLVLLNIPFYKKIVLISFLMLSPAIWYLHWSHPETLAGLLTFIACVLYFENKRFGSMLFFCITAIHFQPLAIPALIIILQACWINRKSIQFSFLLKYFGTASIVFIPIVYNLLLFKTPSIISKMGYLSFDRVNFSTLHSFFFDFNQGVIIAAPLFLMLLFVFPIADLFRKKPLGIYILVASIFLMAFLFLQMINWNHGNEVVNRYVVWITSIIMVSIIYRIFQLKRATIKFSLLFVLLASQLFVIVGQSSFKKISWDASENNILSTHLYNHHPNLYNPDPSIFKGRIGESSFTSTESVFVYGDSTKKITKFMFQKNAIDHLIYRGMDRLKLNNFLNSEHNIEGWYYLNQPDFEKVGYDPKKDELVISYHRAAIEAEIYKYADWINAVKKRALDQGVSEAEAVKTEIDYQMESQFGIK
jgi:hypothetical protein